GQILYGLNLWDSVHGLQSIYNPPGAGFTANALNSAGQAAGYRYGPHGYWVTYLYSGGQATPLGYLPGDSASREYDLNDASQVVGTSGTLLYGGLGSSFQPRQAFVWANGQRTGLGFLPGTTVSDGHGINSFGQAVGTSYAVGTGANARAFLWDKG